MHDLENESTRTDRKSFLKKLGAAAAVGLGVFAIPARVARAGIICCPNYSMCNTRINCGLDHTRYVYCPPPLNCCVCGPSNGGCHDAGPVPC